MAARSVAVVGLVAGAVVAWLARARIERAALRFRVRRLHDLLQKLARHAAVARAYAAAYAARMDGGQPPPQLAERLRVLRLIQRRSLAGLESARAHVDELLLQLHASSSEHRPVSYTHLTLPTILLV